MPAWAASLDVRTIPMMLCGRSVVSLDGAVVVVPVPDVAFSLLNESVMRWMPPGVKMPPMPFTVSHAPTPNVLNESTTAAPPASENIDVPRGVYPDLELAFLPVACQHCNDAPCVKVCPVQATFRRDDGTVLASAHRMFVNLRTSITTADNTAVVDEVERGEDHIKHKFDEAMNDNALSPPALSAITDVYTSVRSGHDQMRDLKKMLHAA